MLDVLLAADCSRCAALCCVALAFDRSVSFGCDKAAGQPCPNLRDDGRCRIHASLAQSGFPGCARYDCAGAGPATTQLFGGRTALKAWQEQPAQLASMLETFRILREVHELLSLLETAGRLPLSQPQAEARMALMVALSPPDGWSLEACARFDAGRFRADARRFFASLSSLAAG